MQIKEDFIKKEDSSVITKEGIIDFLKELDQLINKLTNLKENFIKGLIFKFDDLKHQISNLNLEDYFSEYFNKHFKTKSSDFKF